MNLTYLSLILAVIVALVGLAILLAARGKLSRPPDEGDVFMILGLTWLVLGLANDHVSLGGLGAIFFIIGLSRRYHAAGGR
jgi:hypothetical protein